MVDAGRAATFVGHDILRDLLSLGNPVHLLGDDVRQGREGLSCRTHRSHAGSSFILDNLGDVDRLWRIVRGHRFFPKPVGLVRCQQNHFPIVWRFEFGNRGRRDREI